MIFLAKKVDQFQVFLKFNLRDAFHDHCALVLESTESYMDVNQNLCVKYAN